LVRFFPFGCILKQFRYYTKLGAKRAKLHINAKVRATMSS